jgi:hypothetical protein
MAAIRGFCDLAALAKKAGQPSQMATYAGISQKAQTAFSTVFLDQNSAIAGSVEGLAMNQYQDAAVVEAFTWNIIPDSEYMGTTAQATLSLLQQLRVASGGFKRNDLGQSSYDDNEWILIDLRMSDAFLRVGQQADSMGLVQTVMDKAAVNFNLLPELYNAVPADGAIGVYTGSIPMVGYGAGAFVLTMFDRSGLIEPNDCGDGAGNKPSPNAYTCPGGSMYNGDGGSASSPDGGTVNIPYVNACLCQIHPRALRAEHPPWLAILFLVGVALRRWRRRSA